MRRLFFEIILATLLLPALVRGESTLHSVSDRRESSPPVGISEVTAALEKAGAVAEHLTLPANRDEAAMTELAGRVNDYYLSSEFQGRLRGETERLSRELFGAATTRFYPESTVPGGRLGSDERLYLFISSAMPLSTLRNYADSVARLGDPNVILVLRGFVGGMTQIRPTIRFIASVLQRDPACDPGEGECAMLPAGLAVDPLLFRRYGIDRVPAVVYARGVKAEDAGLSEGDEKNTSIAEHHTLFGDAGLEYLIEQLRRETGSQTLAKLLTGAAHKSGKSSRSREKSE